MASWKELDGETHSAGLAAHVISSDSPDIPDKSQDLFSDTSSDKSPEISPAVSPIRNTSLNPALAQANFAAPTNIKRVRFYPRLSIIDETTGLSKSDCNMHVLCTAYMFK